MEHTIKEYLHLDPESFMDLVQASSEDLKIPIQLIEKDYYISYFVHYPRALIVSKSYLRAERPYPRLIY